MKKMFFISVEWSEDWGLVFKAMPLNAEADITACKIFKCKGITGNKY